MPSSRLEIQLKILPSTPGVYQFFDTKGVVIYVGKANNLKNRVRSYFNKVHDYGKTNVIVYDNERNQYETKTVVTNVTSLVSAIVNPLVDTMKNSIKEYLIDAPRQEGMMNVQMPEAVTVHDPNDITRTTIKETTFLANSAFAVNLYSF